MWIACCEQLPTSDYLEKRPLSWHIKVITFATTPDQISDHNTSEFEKDRLHCTVSARTYQTRERSSYDTVSVAALKESLNARGFVSVGT